jgi:hypothetical protein
MYYAKHAVLHSPNAMCLSLKTDYYWEHYLIKCSDHQQIVNDLKTVMLILSKSKLHPAKQMLYTWTKYSSGH